MKRLFLIFCLQFILSNLIQAQSELTFSEIMFAPESGTSEFIEIYNLGDSSIDLTGYQFKYYTASNDDIIGTGNGLRLNSHSFAVIFENDYDINNGVYKNLVPQNALILKIADNAFGSTGMSNSSDRTLILFNQKGDTVDSYTYSADNQNGYSDEKIFLTNENSASNWSNSKTLYGTPGSQNSVTPLNYDLVITNFTSNKDYEIVGNIAQIEVVIKNTGILNSYDFQLNVFLDINRDSIADNSEIITEYQNGPLQPGDSLSYRFTTSDFYPGDNLFVAKIETSADENLTNNIARYKFRGININEVRNDIVINEIMYAPDSPEPEWVEIYNKSNKNINLAGYKISDNFDTVSVINDSLLFHPGEFFVISADSSIRNFYNFNSGFTSANLPTLNNYDDKIIILDSLNRVIDSLHYFDSWHNPNFLTTQGRSLERINPFLPANESSNWSTSANPGGATPGEQNSIYTISTNNESQVSVTPNPFSPDNDGYEDFTIIHYNLPQKIAQVRVRDI